MQRLPGLQDREHWGVDGAAIAARAQELGVVMIRRPVRFKDGVALELTENVQRLSCGIISIWRQRCYIDTVTGSASHVEGQYLCQANIVNKLLYSS